MNNLIGKKLHDEGYKLQTFFYTKKVARTYYCYEYSIFNERIDTFKFTKKKSYEEFISSMKEQGFYITEW